MCSVCHFLNSPLNVLIQKWGGWYHPSHAQSGVRVSRPPKSFRCLYSSPYFSRRKLWQKEVEQSHYRVRTWHLLCAMLNIGEVSCAFTGAFRLLGYAKIMSNNLQNRSVAAILGWEHYAAVGFVWCKQVSISWERNCSEGIYFLLWESLNMQCLFILLNFISPS